MKVPAVEYDVTYKGQSVIQFFSEVKPEVGEYLHFPHLGGYEVLKICHRISDDNKRAEDEMMWIELICKKLGEDDEDE